MKALSLFFIFAMITSIVAGLSVVAHGEDEPLMEDPPPLLKKLPVREETLRGQRLQKQLEQTDEETQITWLGTGKDEFLGLYRQDNSGEPFANILILHDNLQHPDWPGIVHQLRTQLSESGWNTLSIAVPDYQPKPKPMTESTADINSASEEAALNTEATEPPDMMPSAMPDESSDDSAGTMEQDLTSADVEYPTEKIPSLLNERVKLAIAFLQEKSPAPIIVTGHGLSASLIAKEAQNMLLQNIAGLVVIDPIGVTEWEGFNSQLDAMDLRIPVLDIAPEFNPRTNPELRKKNATRLRHQLYRQRIIRGSNQNFSGFEAAVMKAIRGWGETHFKRP